MDLFVMNKKLDEFIRTKENSALLSANLLHPFQDAGKSENLIQLFIDHNSVTSCRPLYTSMHSAPLNSKNMIE